MKGSEHKKCIAIGCHLHKQCALPRNYYAAIKIWPPNMGEACPYFIWRDEWDDESND